MDSLRSPAPLDSRGCKRLVEIRYEGDDGPARRRPKYASSLFRIAFRILDLSPTDYHIKLSDLYSTEDERICSATKSRKGLHSSHTQSRRALGQDVQITVRPTRKPHGEVSVVA